MKKQVFVCECTETLLQCIAKYKNDLSNKTIKNYIKNKMVLVNNKVIVNSSYIVNTGDNIEISYSKKMIPESNLDILYEDEYLIAINKPYGLLSISNDKEKILTAYRMVSDYVKHSSKNKFIFVVHRIDQDTSGILIFAKDKKVRDILQENWNNMVKKRGYIAIVSGNMTGGSGTIHTYLSENKEQFVYSSKNNLGKEAITHYNVIKNKNNYSLIQLFIDTGRRNQIRVHLSEKGFPIVGDKKYKCRENPIKRMALHANILEFIHPVSKKIIHIESECPSEFNKLIK